MSNDMFIKAAQVKLRFMSVKGALSVEDLFDLPLTSTTGKANLDDIARNLHRSLKEGDEISFVNDTKTEDTANRLAFEIVKYVIEVKKVQRAAAAVAAEKAAMRQKIMAKIEEKKDKALDDKGLEDLQAMLASL